VPNLLLTGALNVPSVRSMLPPQDVMNVPGVGDRVLPTPTGAQITAGLETGLEAPGAILKRIRPAPSSEVDLSGMFGRNLADAEALMQEHPGAANVGEMVGDAATLFTGRAPIANLKAPLQKARREGLEKVARERLRLPSEIEEEVTDIVSKRIVPFLQSTGRLTARAGTKATGVGIEGATLALLDEGDAESMFWFGAGGQLAGSASLFLVEKPVKRLLPFVATAYVASEMFKAATPGEQNFFESKDFAIQKAVAAFTLGTGAAVAGAGRLRGPMAERFPILFDSFTAAPRGAILGRLNELTKASQQGNDLPLKVMEKFASNPSAFNQNIQNSLGRAMNSEKAGVFSKEVDRLMRESEAFREAMSDN
jgi:hypothetical protein